MGKIIARKLDEAEDGLAGYIAHPDRDIPGPALLVIHHNHSLSAELVMEAYDWAARGYTVVIPALFVMAGFREPFVPGSGREIQKQTSDPKFIAIIRKGWDMLAARSDVDAGRIGVIGYCMGGRLGVHFVAATPEVRCFVTYYPSIKDEPETEIRPVHALRPVKDIRCPTFVVFGGDDRVVPNDMQIRIMQTLMENGTPFEWHFYSHGKHGAAAPASDGYQPELARRIHPLAAGFLARELGGAP